jgi:hypothetical protein
MLRWNSQRSNLIAKSCLAIRPSIVCAGAPVAAVSMPHKINEEYEYEEMNATEDVS